MKPLPEVMKSMTQEEFNKLCHSRHYSVLDDARMRVKIELLVYEEELATQTESTSRQQLFNLKIIKMNLERIEARIEQLANSQLRKSEREIERRAHRNMAIALIHKKAQEQHAKQDLLNAKYLRTDEELAKFDPEMLSIKKAVESGVSLAEHAAKLKAEEKAKKEYQFVTPAEAEEAVRIATEAMAAAGMDPATLVDCSRDRDGMEPTRRECNDCMCLLLDSDLGSLCADCRRVRAQRQPKTQPQPKIQPKIPRPSKPPVNMEEEINFLKQLRGETR
jgi:hypothetical protein